MTLRDHVDRYVALKCHLGFKFLNNERMLGSWAAFAMTRVDDMIVADTMISWARDASPPVFARKRLSVGRQFAVRLHAEIGPQSTPQCAPAVPSRWPSNEDVLSRKVHGGGE